MGVARIATLETISKRLNSCTRCQRTVCNRQSSDNSRIRATSPSACLFGPNWRQLQCARNRVQISARSEWDKQARRCLTTAILAMGFQDSAHVDYLTCKLSYGPVFTTNRITTDGLACP